MDQFIINKFWVDCFHAQIAQCSTVDTAVSYANVAVRAYKAWVEGLVEEVEDTPLEKEYCGPLLSDHYWCESIISGEGTYCVNCSVTLADHRKIVKTTDTADIHYPTPYAEDTVEKAVEDINFCNHCLDRVEMWQKAGVELRKQMRVDNKNAEELSKALESVITKTKFEEAIGQFETAMNNYYAVAPEKALGVLDKALNKTEEYYKKVMRLKTY